MPTVIKVKNNAGINQFKRQIIQKNKPCFAMFHMKGCGHCDELRPKWDRIKKKVGGNTVLAEIDSNSTENVTNLIRNKLDIVGYPTLVVIKNGRKIKEYQGAREEEPILQFIRENFLTKGGFKRRSRRRRSRRRRSRRRRRSQKRRSRRRKTRRRSR